MNEQTISFKVEAWMALTGCSEPQALAAAEWTSYHHEGMVVALLSMGKCLDL